jgi:hypothetical protein
MNRLLWQSRWKVLILYIALVAVFMVIIFLTFFTNIFRTSPPGTMPQLVWFLITSLFLVALILLLSKTIRILDALEQNSSKLERIAATLEKNRSTLAQLNQSLRLSETARTILFSETNKQLLRDAVLAKLKQQDFETVNQMIDQMARRPEFEKLAEQLRAETNKSRDETDAERLKPKMEEIDKLLESHQWVPAGTQIEDLTRAHPNSEAPKALRQKFLDKKEERKKVLLTAWDDAVQRQATNRSLEILRELDQYLTPSEASALEEAAKDVFKTKLHNLGIQFSLAISKQHWPEALRVGREITRDFPNSKMAGEIRENLTALEQKAQGRTT